MLSGGEGGANLEPGMAAILNTFIFPSDPVKNYKFVWTEELRLFDCQITSRQEYPENGDTKDFNIKQLQPMKIGHNTRAILSKFGELEKKQTGRTSNPLYYTSVIDQLNQSPNHHIAKIRSKRTKYIGNKQFGTHVKIEFLSYDGYLLGKMENVHEEREVVEDWIQRRHWTVAPGFPKDVDIYTLNPSEAIIGVEIGLSKMSETREQVESIKFKIADFKEKK